MVNEQGAYSELFPNITFSEPDTFETDCAAIRAAAAGPILLNLQGVDLGYAHGARFGTTLVEKLKTHERLDIASDEGFKIRGYIYLIEFDSGWIKLGYTTDPLTRINKHVKGLCRVHSLRINQLWLSVPTLYPMKVEDELRQHAVKSDGRRVDRKTEDKMGEGETFDGLDFDTMVNAAGQLEYTPVTAENIAVALAERRNYQYEFDIRHAIYPHLREHRSLDGFVVPITRFDGPSISKAPLTEWDLTTVDGLTHLLDTGIINWRAYLADEPEPVAAIEVPQRVGLIARVVRMFRRDRQR
ncbi:GIY-YIG nuclease family protein [Rhodococcus sp. D-46]|uniref:GIY-YIG nuclease family protein n=1 Tax=Rhodococcus sp. D-46 TaxID=2716265 RepID=UPI0013F67DD5|nr:GIY-YIG nuclease family protein [Rhodococcus sp. D-46]